MPPAQAQPWQPTVRRGPIAAEYTSPGPACATLPSLVGARGHDFSRGKKPAYSFGRKRPDLSKEASPGPGAYNVSAMSAKGGRVLSSAKSIHGRYRDLKNSTATTPAPGTYKPEECNKLSVYPRAPKITFGGKWKDGKSKDTPSPNQYAVQSAIGRRHAPGSTSKGMAPGFSLAGREADKQRTDQIPGPGAYALPSDATTRKAAPAYSMTSRNIVMVEPDTKNKPGPGAHFPALKSKHGGYSFGIRHSAYETPLIIDKGH